jgi:hypothetical protein
VDRERLGRMMEHFREVERTAAFRQFHAECCVHFPPESLNDVCRQILRASHRRHGQDEPVDLCFGWGWDAYFPLRRLGIRLDARGRSRKYTPNSLQ